jgi:hypothetical protein
MPAHKFEVGIVVAFKQLTRWLPPDEFQVVRHLPLGDDGAAQYRLKSLLTGQERVAREEHLQAPHP